VKTEICANCGHIIGFLETAHVFKGNVVCYKCNQVLQVEIPTNEIQPTSPPPSYSSKDIQSIKQSTGFLAGVVKWIIILFLIYFGSIFIMQLITAIHKSMRGG